MAKFNFHTLELFKTYESENFWRKVDVGSIEECWVHQNRPNRSGHTSTKFRPFGNFYNHRIAWSLTYGLIPEGLLVLHKCNNPACCNPYHLYLGTHKSNTEDSLKVGTFNRLKFQDGEIERILIMLEEGYTQKHIASVVGCSQAYVSQLKTGKRRVKS